MEARTADGRECPQPTLKKWSLSQEWSGNGISLYSFSVPIYILIDRKDVGHGFDVKHTFILSPWGEIQRLQGLCLWRGRAEAQSVGLRSRLFCSLFSCFSITYFTGITNCWATCSLCAFPEVLWNPEQLGCTWKFEKWPTVRLLCPECPYAPDTFCLSFAYDIWIGAPYRNIADLEKVPGSDVRNRKKKKKFLTPHWNGSSYIYRRMDAYVINLLWRRQ